VRSLSVLAVLLALAACQRGQLAESDLAEIGNRAASLQRAADATTDELVKQVDAESPLSNSNTAGGGENVSK
jgi:hypothetical protein